MTRLSAPAKLNLSLHITSKRADGYHLLQSLTAFTEFGDTLEIAPAEANSITITGPFAAGLSAHDNLVLKAANALGKTARFTLEKNIPVGAGLGGGSSDAAAALSLGTPGQAQKTAPTLGSDVPVCLGRKPAWVEGVGEKLTPVSLKAETWVVLVNPGLPLPTAEVYRNFPGQFTPPCAIPGPMNSFNELIAAIAPLRNDLEKPAIGLLPVIADVLAALRAQNAALARMSGSGATCFALFEKRSMAENAAAAIKKARPGWWCQTTRLLP